MYQLSTGGRRTLAASAFALVLTTAACGTNTGEVDQAVPGAPAAVQKAPFHSSADIEERLGKEKVSEFGEERRGYQYEESRDQKKTRVAPPGKRIPDYRL